MITAANVVNASRGRLLCMTYELLLESIQQAIIAEGENRKKHIDKALQVIKMLVGDLDFDYDLSKQLFAIYTYVQGLMIMTPTKEKLQEAYKLIEMIHNSFEEISKDEQDQPSMQNAQVIYAGMTYGKEDINEMSIENKDRGFKA